MDVGVDPLVAQEVAELAELMLAHDEGIAERQIQLVFATVPEYASMVDGAILRQSQVQHIRDIFAPLVRNSPAGIESFAGAARAQARIGLPLSAVMDACRCGLRVYWDAMAGFAVEAGTSGPGLMQAVSALIESYDRVVRTSVESYREQMRTQIRDEEQRRTTLVQALLEGTVDDISLWELADLLCLPHSGPYIVIVARAADVDRRVPLHMQSILGDLGIDSAWRLTPDAEIGVAGLPRPDEQLDAVVRKLTIGVSRVGVSPPYDDLRSTGKALRMARIALQGATERQQVMVFEDMLGSVAAIAPDLAAGMARRVLGGLDSLPRTDRETILETFGAWLDNQGSADGAARQLFVHPNTVRYRLRRLEERTGRPLSEPRCVAELSVAYEVERRLRPANVKGAEQ